MKNNSKKGGLLKVGLLVGAGALVYNELTKGSTNRSANVGNAIAGAINTTDAAELIRIINGSPALQDYFKRLLGTTSPTVQELVTYINNSYTLEGVSYQSFGGSLIQNGAFEINENIFQDGFSFTGDKINGLKVIRCDKANASFSTEFLIDKRYLLKVRAKISTTTTDATIKIFSSDLDKNHVLKSNGAFAVFSSIPNTTADYFNDYTFYFGGIGTSSTFFADNAVFGKLVLDKGTGNLLLCQLSLEQVSLGEPVPSNLPWLPVGQEVKDPTTGDRGTYNGITIDWYTMV